MFEYPGQFMMLYGSFIILWIYGFTMYFVLGKKYKKEREEAEKKKKGGNQ